MWMTGLGQYRRPCSIHVAMVDADCDAAQGAARKLQTVHSDLWRTR